MPVAWKSKETGIATRNMKPKNPIIKSASQAPPVVFAARTKTPGLRFGRPIAGSDSSSVVHFGQSYRIGAVSRNPASPALMKPISFAAVESVSAAQW
jgi:hypothetical protein